MDAVPASEQATQFNPSITAKTILGYRGALEGAYISGKLLPITMTMSGLAKPAKALVIGDCSAAFMAASVLQKMGAETEFYANNDKNIEAINILKCKFICPKIQQKNTSHELHNKKNLSILQSNLLSSILGDYDIIINAENADKSPNIISQEMINQIKPGAVIVDLYRNIPGSSPGKIINKKNVKIICMDNVSRKTAIDSSNFYAKNLYNFIEYALKDGRINLNDEIIQEMLLTTGGNLVNKEFKV